jgi:outer membrane lipopolysaccharide assembly protein LptE/RlpB
MIMHKRLTRLYFFMGFAYLAVLMSSGCGYSLHRQADLPFTEIRIGKIENRSLEPKLQDRLHKALVREFTKNGITVTPSAGNVLSGVVRKFEMISLSERKDITVEYRIIIDADFTYKDNEGKIREIKKLELPFIISSFASEDMSLLLGSREMATEKAVADIAMEIVGALIYK